MSHSNPDRISRRRNRLLIVLSGCAVFALCALCACVTSTGHWFLALPVTKASQETSNAVIRAQVASLPKGDANNGEQLYATLGCKACHSLEANTRIVGPSLSGIASRSATRKPNYTAEMYLYESIASPNALVVPGFQANIMPVNFGQRLSKQQFADLLAFLLIK